MRNLYLKMILFCVAFGPIAMAQQNTIDPRNCREGESVEYCREHILLEQNLKNPEFAKQWEKDQAKLAQEQQELLSKSKGNIPGKGVVYRIPVVFHVLHNGGAENISKEQILNGLAIWNRDWRRLNADADNVVPKFQGMPADVEIEFVLATKAPDGTCFSGITRTQSSMTSNGSNGGAQVDAIVAGNDVYNGQWPGNRYLNVFVCKDIGGAAGYTYRPSNFQGTSMKNGIWVLHNYVGAIGTSNENTSRTMTHEAGHWLNLPHCWGGTNTPGLASNCNTDDGIADTPNTIGSQSCLVNEATCGDTANVENYMDYSYCSKMFTPGQVTTMRTAINSTVGGRNNLWTSQNIALTGADSVLYICKADFTAPLRTVCAGGTIDFVDASFNAVNGWNWSFPGGSPATSTSANPSVVYNTPGTYAVTLTATDGSTSQSTTKTNFITVLPAGVSLPYQESFEGYTDLINNSFWTVNNVSGSNEFEIYTGAGATGNKSVRLRNFGQAGENTDELISKNYDLTNFNSSDVVTFSFKYAYRKRTSADYESLRILLSNDCGEVFTQRKSINGTQLSNVAVGSEWTPTESDWVQAHVTNVTSQYFVDNLQVMFRFLSDNGNNIYLDDINFYKGGPESVGLEEMSAANNIALYPNPADDEVNVSFNVASAGKVILEVRDITGKIINTQVVNASAGQNLVMMETNTYAAGMYFMNVVSGNNTKTIQFAVK